CVWVIANTGVQVTPIAGRVIDHKQVVTYRVVTINIATREEPGGTGNRGPLLIENLVANFLSLAYLRGGLGQPYFHRAEAAHCSWSPVTARGRCAQAAVGLQ